MPDKAWREGRWYSRPWMNDIEYLPPGLYEVNAMRPEVVEGSVVLDTYQLETLIRFLDEQGYIKPRLDERLRVEDLKITHRLLDLLEKKLPG